MGQAGNSPRVGTWPLAAVVLAALILATPNHAVLAAQHVTRGLEPGAIAVLQNGTQLYLQCTPGRVRNPDIFARSYLKNPAVWKQYKNLEHAASIPASHLRPEAVRALLFAVFPKDYVDERGWHHTVTVDQAGARENLANLCTWLTGTQLNEDKILAANGLTDRRLRRGQKVFFPSDLLWAIMREPTPDRIPVVSPLEPLAEDSLFADLEERRADRQAMFRSASNSPLTYTSDGAYAEYHLQKGEALYSSVVVRFTNFRENKDIKAAVNAVQKISGIKDVRDIDAGTVVRIPVGMLANQYQPLGSEQRKHYEAVLRAAEQERGAVRSPDLNGVVVVLDPGHGGADPGTKNTARRLFEDEIAYDIVCRIRRILNAETGAKTYVTMFDPNQSYTPTNATRFVHDEDEQVKTNPLYHSTDSTRSVILRWYLANDIFLRETKAGVDPRKIVFTSMHCDALFNEKIRGAMVYIPDAQYRPGSPTYHKQREGYTSASYARYAENKTQPFVSFSYADRMRDEALSRNFAETLMDQLGRHRVKRHLEGPNIRSLIHRHHRGKPISMVPGVLRCNMIPTKVLVETANMSNPTDRERLADPKWRETFARAYVNALKVHYRAYEQHAQR
jgi:N-acetylmuramoyl-L-alanine amidase